MIDKRFAVTLLITQALWWPGCNTLRHSEAKSQALEQWNLMRGRVKQNLAEQRYHAGQFEDTVRTISEAIGLNPKNPDAYVLLAQANLELGRASSSQAALDAARAAGIRSPALDYMTGVLLELRGELQPATEWYGRARAGDPTQADYLVAEAECLVALGQPVEALKLLEVQGDRLDDDGTLAALRGHIAAMVGDVPSATRGYRAALTASAAGPTVDATANGWTDAARGNGVVAAELARMLVRSGRYLEAVSVLSPLLARSSTVAGEGDVRRTAATAFLALGDAPGAIQALTPYADEHPEDSAAQLLLAKAALANNDTVLAWKCVERVEPREPDRLELWLVRATLNWRGGQLGKAAGELYDVLQNSPDDVEAHCLLAEVLQEQKRLDAARTHFEEALRINPDCAWATAGLKKLRRASLPAPKPPRSKLTSNRIDSA